MVAMLAGGRAAQPEPTSLHSHRARPREQEEETGPSPAAPRDFTGARAGGRGGGRGEGGTPPRRSAPRPAAPPPRARPGPPPGRGLRQPPPARPCPARPGPPGPFGPHPAPGWLHHRARLGCARLGVEGRTEGGQGDVGVRTIPAPPLDPHCRGPPRSAHRLSGHRKAKVKKKKKKSWCQTTRPVPAVWT